MLAVVDEVAKVERRCSRAESRGLTIAFEVDESVPARAVGDARGVTQVLTGLVQNALTFTERGGDDVRVNARGAAPNPDGTA